MQYCGNTQPTYIRKWKYSYNMKLMSNTAASYPMGAGRFEPWLFVNCYRVYSCMLHYFNICILAYTLQLALYLCTVCTHIYGASGDLSIHTV